jgi:Acyl-CoA dehydrogenase, C-terminal domain
VAYSSSVFDGRPKLTAVALGIPRAVVGDTVRFCRERVLYGKPLLKLDAVSLKLGEMQSSLMTARVAAYHAVRLLDRGIPCDAELINAMLINTEYLLDSARNAVEIFAARGLQKWYNIERYPRDAARLDPPAGTSDVQRLRLGQGAAGFYGPQWSARLADPDNQRPGARPGSRAGGAPDRRGHERTVGRRLSTHLPPRPPKGRARRTGRLAEPVAMYVATTRSGVSVMI